jgi:hypothetical protein
VSDALAAERQAGPLLARVRQQDCHRRDPLADKPTEAWRLARRFVWIRRPASLGLRIVSEYDLRPGSGVENHPRVNLMARKGDPAPGTRRRNSKVPRARGARPSHLYRFEICALFAGINGVGH